MPRPRKYESTNDRVRAWRKKKRIEAEEIESQRKEAERALRLQHNAEFEKLYPLLLQACKDAPGIMQDVHGAAMLRVLEDRRDGLELKYHWERRFPDG